MEILTIDQILNPPQKEVVGKAKGFLGKEDFLLLMVTQMRLQNPLDPLDNQDFAAQLAQFSSLEQLTNLNETMELAQIANLGLTQSITNTMAASLIGKRVLAENNQLFHISPQKDVINFTLTDPADTVTIRIVTATGNVLLEKDLGGMPKGTHEFAWDGVDNNGNLVSDGKYLFEIVAEGSEGENVAGRAMAAGIVTGVRFRDGRAYLIVNNVEIPINEVQEVLAGPNESGL